MGGLWRSLGVSGGSLGIPGGLGGVPGEVLGEPRRSLGSPRGILGGRLGVVWGVSGVAGRVPGAFQCEAEIVEKPLVFVVFPGFGGARSDMDSQRELSDVATRSLLEVPEILGGS